jgi:hypothetical protein
MGQVCPKAFRALEDAENGAIPAQSLLQIVKNQVGLLKIG